MNASKTVSKPICNFGKIICSICFLTVSLSFRVNGVIANPRHKTSKISCGTTEFFTSYPLQSQDECF